MWGGGIGRVFYHIFFYHILDIFQTLIIWVLSYFWSYTLFYHIFLYHILQIIFFFIIFFNHIFRKSIGIFITKFRKYTCQSMSVSRIRMYPAKSLLVNSCAPWINPHLKVLFWEIVDRIIHIFTARSKLVLPFMAKCSNVQGWRYNMRYLSIYERWKF